jgi:D-2-hydroxyacid dehydrogenase (NADP+)
MLAHMQPGSILINLARGNIVDETALEKLLRSGRIRSAALDVFAEEPLPPESPLWSTPGVIVTPHVGGLSDRYAEQALPIVLHNVRLYLDGRTEELKNIIWSQ